MNLSPSALVTARDAAEGPTRMAHVQRSVGPRRLRAYLAGPDVFEADARAIGSRKQAICAAFGFEGLYPLDNEVAAGCPFPDREIHTGNLAMLQAADLGIFNLTPFRGPSADPGTVFELGYLAARGVPVFGYTLCGMTYRERVNGRYDAATARWLDADGRTIEDFGNADNLMIDISLEATGGMTRGQSPQDADVVLEQCIKAAAAWMLVQVRRKRA